jgi:SWI/SNF-related matrix-associated actin-dependent regulator of chromatin subfamily A-like protein 1
VYEKVYLEPTDKLMSLSKREKEEQDKMIGAISSIRQALGILKVEPAIEHLEDLLEQKEKIVVFAWHTEVIKGIKDHFGARAVTYTGAESAVEKEEAIDAFTSRQEVKMFVGQLKAAGTGIDGLQAVCDVCVFVEMSYVPGEIIQAVDRLRRIGQFSSVLAQFLIVEDSMDEALVDNLTEKAKNIKTVMGDKSESKFALSFCAACREMVEFAKLRPAAGLSVCAKCEKKMGAIL